MEMDQSEVNLVASSVDDGHSINEGRASTYIPKVRKPYTITKPRERWTEEEHQKFIEALKLYGRTWRQIEEHIGTKTAIQIRSHAQKFFTKVSRDSTGNSSGSLRPADIPPPRPKKKPLHPYPRKMADSMEAGAGILHFQPEMPSSPKASAGERDQSPTSVLSSVGSETFDSTSRREKSYPSNSCSTDGQCASLLPAEKEKEKECMTSVSSIERPKAWTKPSLVQTRCDNPNMHPSNVKDDHAMGSSITSIKLLGKTVWITDSQKLSFLNQRTVM